MPIPALAALVPLLSGGGAAATGAAAAGAAGAAGATGAAATGAAAAIPAATGMTKAIPQISSTLSKVDPEMLKKGAKAMSNLKPAEESSDKSAELQTEIASPSIMQYHNDPFLKAETQRRYRQLTGSKLS